MENNFKTIKVAREQINGRLDLAILTTLNEKGLLSDEEYRNYVKVEFMTKNNRANGKSFCIVIAGDYKYCFWVSKVYRFNSWQECTLKALTQKEIYSLDLEPFLFKNVKVLG